MGRGHHTEDLHDQGIERRGRGEEEEGNKGGMERSEGVFN